MATEKRLIDAKKALYLAEYSGLYDFDLSALETLLLDEPCITVDAVEVDAIQAWLYEIAMNNTGNVSRVCEELISRLDGLRVFAKERRTDNA